MNFPETMILRRITGREKLGHGTLLPQYPVRQDTGAAVLPKTVCSLETMAWPTRTLWGIWDWNRCNFRPRALYPIAYNLLSNVSWSGIISPRIDEELWRVMVLLYGQYTLTRQLQLKFRGWSRVAKPNVCSLSCKTVSMWELAWKRR